MILWDRPGTVKTTVARSFKARQGLAFEQISAIFSGLRIYKGLRVSTAACVGTAVNTAFSSMRFIASSRPAE